MLTIGENVSDLGAISCITQLEGIEENPDYETLYRSHLGKPPYMQATFTNAYNILKPKKTEVVYETPVADENSAQE